MAAKQSNIEGTEGSDTLVGNQYNNRIRGGGGADVLYGGDGVDTAVFSGKFSEYNLSYTLSLFTVKTVSAPSYPRVIDQVDGRDDADTIISGIEYLQFSDCVVSLDAFKAGRKPSFSSAAPTPSAESREVAASLPNGVAIADQLAVVYMGRGITAKWRDATAPLVDNGASEAMLKAFFVEAVKDNVFSADDAAQAIVNQTFLNIFGVEASSFEQNAWANIVTGGIVSREALPWAMFNAYLGATNVPPSYQVPAQSRIIAAHAFTDAVTPNLAKVLGDPAAVAADPARAWLQPIRTQADAAAKVLSAAGFVATLTDSLASGGPTEALADQAMTPLIGVATDLPGSFGDRA